MRSIQKQLSVITKLTGVEKEQIEISEEGFLSRVYVIDGGRIVFKFPRRSDVKYDNEIKVLNVVKSLGVDINLQKVGWISNDDSYLGLYGVKGKSIKNLKLTLEQKKNIGEQIANFLKKFHGVKEDSIFTYTLEQEITAWQARYNNLFVQEFVETNFSKKDQNQLDFLMNKYMPETLNSLGEKLVFSHGDLGDNNIFIDEKDKVGIIDFNTSMRFEEAADFMDVGDDELRNIILDKYGADENLVKKVMLRKDLFFIIVIKHYIEKYGASIIKELVDKIKLTLKKYEKLV